MEGFSETSTKPAAKVGELAKEISQRRGRIRRAQYGRKKQGFTFWAGEKEFSFPVAGREMFVTMN